MKRCLLCLLVLVAVLGAVAAWALAAGAASPNPRVVPAGATVGGLGYCEWADRWMQWAYAHPASVDWVAEAAFGQDPRSPVFFLPTWGPPSPPPFEASLTVPAGKLLLVPLGAWSSVWAPATGCCGASTLDDFFAHAPDCAAAWVDLLYTGVYAEVDGRPISAPEHYRFASEAPFLVTFPPDSMFASAPCALESTSTWAYTDGYWLLLAPLSAGSHELRFGSDLGDTVLHVTVAPKD